MGQVAAPDCLVGCHLRSLELAEEAYCLVEASYLAAGLAVLGRVVVRASLDLEDRLDLANWRRWASYHRSHVASPSAAASSVPLGVMMGASSRAGHLVP